MEQPKKDLYKKLNTDGVYTKSYEEFEQQFSSPEGQGKLYQKLNADGKYTKSKEEFVGRFFAEPVKKKGGTQVGKSDSIIPTENTALVQQSGSSAILPQPKTKTKPNYRLPKDSDFSEMQNKGLVAPSSELKFKKLQNEDLENLYDLNPDGTKKPTQKKPSLTSITQTNWNTLEKSTNKSTAPIAKDRKLSLPKDYVEKVPEELKSKEFTEELYNFTPKDKENLKKEINSKIEDNDLNLDNPYLFYSTFDKQDSQKDNFIDATFGEEKLKSIGIDVADFDGFLNKKGYKNDFIGKQEKGLFNGEGTGKESYNIQFAQEREKKRLLDLYIGENNARKLLKSKLTTRISNLEVAGKDKTNEEDITPTTIFNDENLKKYIKEEMPLLSEKIEKVEAESKEIYQKHKSGDANLLYGTEKFFKSAGYGFIDRINQISSTIYEKVGADERAQGLRFLNEERQLSRPQTRDVGYAKGLTTEFDGRDYLLTDDGRVIDQELKIDVTDLLQKFEYDAIKNFAKEEKKSDFTFSPQGSAIQLGAIAGDMIVQLALTKSLSNVVPSLAQIPLSGSDSASIITQSALGYTQGVSETYDQAIKAGINEKDAKLLANEAGQNMAILYAVTAPLSPQTKATQALFGSEGKELIKKAVASYVEKGKQGFIQTLKNGLKTIPRGATEWIEEGLIKEGTQELTQQAGESYVVNKRTNELAGQKLNKDSMTAEDVVNTLILTTLTGGISVVPKMFSKTDILSSYNTLSKDSNFETNLSNLVKNGVVTTSQAEKLKRDVTIFKNQSSKIPKNLNKNIAMDVMSDLQDISDLESKKKGLDKSFHEDIDAEIEAKRELIKDRVKFNTLSKEEILKLKEKALKELNNEQNPDGETNVTIDDAQITKRANEIYTAEQAEIKAKKDAETQSAVTNETKPEAKVQEQAEAEKVDKDSELGRLDAYYKKVLEDETSYNWEKEQANEYFADKKKYIQGTLDLANKALEENPESGFDKTTVERSKKALTELENNKPQAKVEAKAPIDNLEKRKFNEAIDKLQSGEYGLDVAPGDKTAMIKKGAFNNIVEIELTKEEQKEIERQFRFNADGDLSNEELRQWRKDFEKRVAERYKLENQDAKNQPQAKAEKVKELRADEQVELKEALPNAELNSEGKIDEEKLSEEDKVIFDKIYDKYDKLISPLLEDESNNNQINKPNENKVSQEVVAEIPNPSQIKNEATPTKNTPTDGNVSIGTDGLGEVGNGQKPTAKVDTKESVQPANDVKPTEGEAEVDINDIEGFLSEQFGPKKPIAESKKKESVKPKEKVAPKEEKLEQAKGFVSLAVDKLTTSLKDFQGRAKEFSEDTYNRIVNEAKEGILNISSIPPIQVWKNPETGQFVILAGHSRTKAFSDLAEGKVEFADKYKKSDFEKVNTQIVEAETLKEAQKIAQESNQGSAQTVVDNAKYVRESLLPTFNNFNQVKTKLKSLYGSAWARIYAYANLNPKGKAMQMLKQFQDSNESASDDKSKKIAEWTGKARSEFGKLTDAHENEIFDYLLKNDKVKTYAELSELLNRRVNGLEEFNQNEPLNFEQKVGRGSNEVEAVKEIQDLKNRDAQIKKKIKELQSFGKNINDTQRKQIKDLTAESIKINTVDIPNAQKKQKQARVADAEQFDIFSQINEQIENGNITPEQVDEFVNDDRKAEEIEPIVKAVEGKAKSEKKAELEEVLAEVEEFLSNEEAKQPIDAKQQLKDKANAEVDKIAQKIKDLLPGINDPDVKVNGFSQDQLIDLVAKAVKNLINAGIEIDEAIRQVASSIKDKFGIDVNPDDVKAKLEPQVEQEPFERKQGQKSLMTRGATGNSAMIKKAISKYSLNYEVESQEVAKENAEKFVDEVGIDNALDAVRSNKIVGAEKAFVYNKVIEEIQKELQNATDSEISELEELHTKVLGEIFAEFDQESRNAGRFISALNKVYLGSKGRYNLSKRVKEYKALNDGKIPADILAKFKEADAKIKELEAKIEEYEKIREEQESVRSVEEIIEAISRKGKIDRSKGISDKAKAKAFADKLRSYKTTNKGNLNASTPFSLAFDGAIEIIATSIEAGGKISSAIKQGIDYIKNQKLNQDEENQAIAQVFGAFEQADSQQKGLRIDDEGKITIPHSLLREKVENGIDNVEDLVTAIQQDLAELYPNEEFTDRQVRDAITNYGKTTNPTKEDVEVQISIMKSLGKLISGLEDAYGGKRPLKSGLQRRPKTLEERAKEKKLKELLRDLPMDTADLAKSWKTALDTIKSRLRNEIADIDDQTAKGEKRKGEKKQIEYDQEANELKAERDAKKEILDELVGKPELTEEEKIDKATILLQKSIDTLQENINNGEIEFKTKPTPVTSAKLEEMRNTKKALQKQMQEMRQDAGLVEMKRLESAKKSRVTRVKELQRRIKEKDFSQKERKTLPIDAELLKLDSEVQDWKDVFEKEKYKQEQANRSKFRKVTARILNLLGLPRLFKATGEFSPVLVQMGFIVPKMLITDRKGVRIAMYRLLAGFVSADSARKFEAETKNHPLHSLMIKTKLSLTGADHKLDATEEMFESDIVNDIINSASDIIDKRNGSKQRFGIIGTIKKFVGADVSNETKKTLGQQIKDSNPFKMFERASVSFSNYIKINQFEKGVRMLQMDLKDPINDIDDYKKLSNVINVFSGRPSLGKVEQISREASNVFFSMRLAYSQILQLSPYFYIKLGDAKQWKNVKSPKDLLKIRPTVAQKMAVSNFMISMGTIAGFMTAFMAIANKASGDDEEKWTIETDPRSTNFGRLIKGELTFDVWHGLNTYYVMMSRVFFLREIKNDDGEIKKLGEGIFTPDAGELLGRHVVAKFSPTFSYAWNLLNSTKKVGKNGQTYLVDRFNNIHNEATVKDLFVPIYWNAVNEVRKEDPDVYETFLTAVGLLGMGIGTPNTGTKFKDVEGGRQSRPTRPSRPSRPER
jgi:hypothetical protein